MLKRLLNLLRGKQKAPVKEQVSLSAMGQQIAGLTAAVYSGHSQIDDLRRRIERRLELKDTEQS